MRAIVYTEYGSPDVLELREVEVPAPKDNEALVRVHAASVSAADLDQLRGTFMVRIGGLRKPRYKVLGSDIAGRVEAVGRSAKQFQPGDEVFGDLSACGFGAFAEYVCVPEYALALKPVNLTFEEAAAVPESAVLALQSLRDKRQTQPGHKVLINGAGGGVGTFAVQLAKHFGAEVTAVDSRSKLEMLRSIGADHVIDTTQEDYTTSGQRYDRVVDCVANRSLIDYRRALSANGVFVVVGGSMGAILQAVFLGPLISKTGSQQMGILMWKPSHREDVDYLRELLESGKVVPVIDRRYPLSEVREALRYLEEEPHLGKVVITM